MRMPNGLRTQEEELQQINQMEWKDLTVEELRVNMTRAANWKSHGPDRLPNFWIKQFKSLRKSWQKHTPKLSRTQSKLQTG